MMKLTQKKGKYVLKNFSFVNKLINDTENIDLNKSSDNSSVISGSQSPSKKKSI